MDPAGAEFIYLNYGFAAAVVWFLLHERQKYNERIVLSLKQISIILDERVPKKEN